jgi:chemotaxis family two-component system sensor kinase Cph1
LALHSLATPAFGKADLSNCEREEIHLAGSIQPHGALLVVSEPDHRVIQASANAAEFLNLKQVIGVALADLDGDLLVRILPHLDPTSQGMPIAVRCRIGSPSAEFDGLLHRPPAGGLVIELERAGPSVDLSRQIANALEKIRTASSLRALCEEAATLFQDRTGYDRVMVYRFDDEGHGEVFSERRKAELEAFLGNRYPASDIPQIARRLYERNRVRVLVDMHYVPVPLTPRLSPITGQDLDMSLCCLRSPSPIHVQYLKNMGVSATLVASLLVGGRLWGLIACHHYEPRFVHFEIRAVVELLAEAVATRIAALESFVQAQSELIVRRLEQRMVEAISRDGDWRMALFDASQSLLQPLGASGAALMFEGQVLSTGEVPATQDVREIAAWFDQKPRENVMYTASLGLDEPKLAELTSVASGVLAVPISAAGGEYLMWFRPERVRTVTWGGDPQKPVIIGSDPSELSPRRSFAQWHQVVEGTSDPWTPADITSARLIGETVADVAFQFRSVRMLIAQDQLEQISRQVRSAPQPVIVTDPKGRILLTNEAFEKLLRAIHPHLQWLDDLPPLFSEPIEVRRNLRHMLQTMQSWRGEVQLLRDMGESKPLMVRGDPVFATPDRALGFVLLFNDLSERKAAEAARRRFQEGVMERQPVALRLDSKDSHVYQNILSSVVENAQLAALEITYGVDTARMPEMLESVRSSVTRSAEVLEHLVWHASRSGEKK